MPYSDPMFRLYSTIFKNLFKGIRAYLYDNYVYITCFDSSFENTYEISERK